MSANFWKSSHATSWILNPRDLALGRLHDSDFLNDDEYQKIFIFFANFIQAIGEQLNIRQQVIATATVYFRRFYARNSLKSIDPLIVAPTCVLLASKVEEFGVQSNSRLRGVCETVLNTRFSYAYSYAYPYDVRHFLDCEFYLTEFLECSLIVYQPYRSLQQIIKDLRTEDSELFTVSWQVINDSLRTDVCMLFAPHQIAIGCMQIACVILKKDLSLWFAELNVDFNKVREVIQHLINLYELWSNWNEEYEIPDLLKKMPKPNPIPYF